MLLWVRLLTGNRRKSALLRFTLVYIVFISLA